MEPLIQCQSLGLQYNLLCPLEYKGLYDTQIDVFGNHLEIFFYYSLIYKITNFMADWSSRYNPEIEWFLPTKAKYMDRWIDSLSIDIR